MFTVKPETHVKRDATIYARVQGANKAFVKTQAKKYGFESEAAYVDAVFTQVRKTTKAYKKTKRTQK